MLGTPGQRKNGASAPTVSEVLPRGAGVGVRGAHERVTVTAAARVGIDDDEPDVRAVVALDGGDDADVRITANDRRLLRREQRAVELVDASARSGCRARHRSAIGRERGAVEEREIGHGPTVPGIDASSASCARARSRFWPGTRRSVVHVARDPVGQEAQRLLVGDDRAGALQRFVLGGGRRRAFGQAGAIAGEDRRVELEIHHRAIRAAVRPRRRGSTPVRSRSPTSQNHALGISVSRSTRHTASSPSKSTLSSFASLCATRRGTRAHEVVGDLRERRGRERGRDLGVDAPHPTARIRGDDFPKQRQAAARARESRATPRRHASGVEVGEPGVEAAEQLRGGSHSRRCRLRDRLGAGDAPPRAPRVVAAVHEPAAARERPPARARTRRADASTPSRRCPRARAGSRNTIAIDPLHDVVAGRGRREERLVDVATTERADRVNGRGEVELCGHVVHGGNVGHDNALRTAARSASCVTPKQRSSHTSTRTVAPAPTCDCTTSGSHASPSRSSATNSCDGIRERVEDRRPEAPHVHRDARVIGDRLRAVAASNRRPAAPGTTVPSRIATKACGVVHFEDRPRHRTVAAQRLRDAERDQRVLASPARSPRWPASSANASRRIHVVAVHDDERPVDRGAGGQHRVGGSERPGPTRHEPLHRQIDRNRRVAHRREVAAYLTPPFPGAITMTARSKPAAAARRTLMSMIAAPSAPTSASCLSPPNREPDPAASTTTVKPVTAPIRSRPPRRRRDPVIGSGCGAYLDRLDALVRDHCHRDRCAIVDLRLREVAIDGHLRPERSSMSSVALRIASTWAASRPATILRTASDICPWRPSASTISSSEACRACRSRICWRKASSSASLRFTIVISPPPGSTRVLPSLKCARAS